jgi:DNA-binding SARP family transcriptional activator
MPQTKIKIKMFGNFEIIVNGNVVLSQLRQAKKTCQFLEYLILKKDRAVPHEELLEMLWSDKENRNPATALRTLCTVTVRSWTKAVCRSFRNPS